MNSYLLRKAFRQQCRKRALRIAVVVHVFATLSFMLFFINTPPMQEMEDEIHVELISELPKQQIKEKKAQPIPKKEAPKEEIPILRKERTLQKKKTVVQPEQSLEIAKMSPAAPKRIGINVPTHEKIDVDAPLF